MSITARGGYQIVDFQDKLLLLNADPIIIPGIWEQVNNTYNKPLVLYNLYLQTDPLAQAAKYPVYTLSNITVMSNGILLSLGPEVGGFRTETIFINSDDSVSFTND